MKRDEILEAIYELARSQGYYNRLANSLAAMKKYSPSDYNNIITDLEAQHFKDITDMILYLEG